MDARMLVGQDPRNLQTRRMMPDMGPEALVDPQAVSMAPPPTQAPPAGPASLAGAPRQVAPQAQPAQPAQKGYGSIQAIRQRMRADVQGMMQQAGLPMDESKVDQYTDYALAQWGAAQTKRLGKAKEKRISKGISALQALENRYATFEMNYENEVLPWTQRGRKALAIKNDPNAAQEEREKANVVLLEAKEHIDAIKGKRDTLRKAITDLKTRLGKENGLSPQDIDDMIQNPFFDSALRSQTESSDFLDDEPDDDPSYGAFYPGSANAAR